MSCTQVREALSARLDGETSPDEDVAVDTHLATCASCAEHEAAIASLNRSLRVRVAPAITGSADEVAASLVHLVGTPRPRRRIDLRVVAAAALGTAAAVGVVAVIGTREPARPVAGPNVLEVSDARATPTGARGVSIVSFTVRNPTARSTAIVGAATPVADATTLHVIDDRSMRSIDQLEVPAHDERRLTGTGSHIMIVGALQTLRDGDRIPLVVSFSDSPPVTVTVEVGT